MILSRESLGRVKTQHLVPQESLFQLPEKVLQFGTGVLLRGLPDYFIDKANRQGIFNGRIVVVKSTGTGGASGFDDQDGLFTHAIKGIENNEKVDEIMINASISRVLAASGDWQAILACAKNPEMKVVISNTTEVGIQLLDTDRVGDQPPRSFPGKLLAFLAARYEAFHGSEESGMVIVPTELIIDNGKKLKDIVTRLAVLNGLPDGFMQWLDKHIVFCNSLVDRIVPGKPDGATIDTLERELGYRDDLVIVSEAYRLWAIEGGEKVRETLAFSQADPGVVIAPDIEIFRELKLRMLNGTHTLSCGIAFLAGFDTVKNAMDNEAMAAFVSSLMLQEIAPAIPYQVNEQEAKGFAAKVLDRFRNPHIEHLWLAITAQFSAKLKMRVLPVLLNHYKHSEEVPEHIAAGFAAYLLFMKSEQENGDQYFGSANGREYRITDDQAAVLSQAWKHAGPGEIAAKVLSDRALWDTDLTLLPGFEASVTRKMLTMMTKGIISVLNDLKSVVA
ncbi:tagaturonate reductase [Hufsiella ginkgonis]|uniref:Tagaturonate reductase n=1 Tax=Hufsiella ginkgonis TaxID=2695274 RepID=A0A7K1Y2W6_9SPHI|nr:tagaturonate reductase [Hufsiella ginkgonis]MXV17572.1 tagaturonate reductase [Hufsiella ginkgonis]